MADESDDQSCYESEASEVSEKIVKQKKLRKKFNTPATSKVTPRKRKPTTNLGKCEFSLNITLKSKNLFKFSGTLMEKPKPKLLM